MGFEARGLSENRLQGLGAKRDLQLLRGSVPVFVEVRQELRGILPSLRACAGAIKNVTEHRPFIDPELSPERLIFPNRSVGLSTRIGLKVTTEGTN